MSTRAHDTLRKLYIAATPGRGWFLSRSAYDVGVSASSLSRLRSIGLVVSPRRNVNRLVDFPRSWESEALGALMLAGPGSALARYAALRVHERRTTQPPLDVVHARGDRQGSTAPAARSHVRLRPDDVVTVDGLRVTSPAFTVADLATIAHVPVLREVAERFMADRRLDLPSLVTMTERFRGVKGVGKLRELVDLVSPAVRGTRSDREREVLRMLVDLGLPAPVADLHVLDAAGRDRYLDLAWPDLKLVIEVDVHPVHGTTAGRRADGIRQNHLVVEGWTVLRFDLTDLTDAPQEMAALIERTYQRLSTR